MQQLTSHTEFVSNRRLGHLAAIYHETRDDAIPAGGLRIR